MKMTAATEAILAPRPRPIVYHPFLPKPTRLSSSSTSSSTKVGNFVTSMEGFVKDIKRNGILTGPESDQKENCVLVAQTESEDRSEIDQNAESDSEDENDAYAEFREIISNVTPSYKPETFAGMELLDSQQIPDFSPLIKSPLSLHRSLTSFEIEENVLASRDLQSSYEDGLMALPENPNLKLAISMSQNNGPFPQASPICRTQNPMPLNSPFLTLQRSVSHNRYHHRHSLPKPKKRLNSPFYLPVETARKAHSGSLESDFVLPVPPKSLGLVDTDNSVRDEVSPSCWVRSRSLSVGDRPMPVAAFIRL